MNWRAYAHTHRVLIDFQCKFQRVFSCVKLTRNLSVDLHDNNIQNGLDFCTLTHQLALTTLSKQKKCPSIGETKCSMHWNIKKKKETEINHEMVGIG